MLGWVHRVRRGTGASEWCLEKPDKLCFSRSLSSAAAARPVNRSAAASPGPWEVAFLWLLLVEVKRCSGWCHPPALGSCRPWVLPTDRSAYVSVITRLPVSTKLSGLMEAPSWCPQSASVCALPSRADR